jgi:alkylated DNA repair protein (DNA oxidative demethylase)
MTTPLFHFPPDGSPSPEPLGPGAVVLRGFALARDAALLAALQDVARGSPFRHMTTPGGFQMSVAMTNCGPLGWVSDHAGYRYDPIDPDTGRAWPPMPRAFLQLAHDAAAAAGFMDFEPDACLVNRYAPGARLTLHQDKDEHDFGNPIVSASLGIPAVFRFGGSSRAERPRRVPLDHGDTVVWGGPARLRYHGVLPVQEANHPLTGAFRYNLTLREAR